MEAARVQFAKVKEIMGQRNPGLPCDLFGQKIRPVRMLPRQTDRVVQVHRDWIPGLPTIGPD